METLVAVSAPPRKQAVIQERPARRPTPAPRMKGTITPPSATKNAAPPALRMRSISVSRPAMNMRTKPPTWASSIKAPVACPPSKTCRCSRSTAPGPRTTPTRRSPRMAGTPQRSQQREGALIAAALDPLPQQRPDRCSLTARKLRLRGVLRQRGRAPGVLFGFPAHPQAHPELAHLQLGDEAVRVQTHRFAELLDRLLDVEMDAEGHAEEHPQLGHFRVGRDRFAQLREQLGPLELLERIGIGKHPEDQGACRSGDRSEDRRSG